MINATRNKKLLNWALCLVALALYCQSPGKANAQRQNVSGDRPWQELVSREGNFRVLLPDAPSEMSLPGKTQGTGGGQLYVLKSSVAVYAIVAGELPSNMEDPDLMKEVLDSTSAFLQAGGKVRVLGEKNISSPGIQARQFIVDDGAFVTTARVYYTKGRIYEVIFSRPGLSGTSANALLQFYDGLSGKFFNSFKIGS